MLIDPLTGINIDWLAECSFPMPFLSRVCLIKAGDALSSSNSSGHRQRLRDRFLRGEEAALSDLSLIELLLTFSIPRKDVRPIAEKLLSKFGSLDGLISARKEDIDSIPGLGEASVTLMSLVKEIAERLNQKSSISTATQEYKEHKVRTRIQEPPRYNAQITAGTLLVHETRKIAKLLLEKGDAVDWNHEILTLNLLQKRNPKTASRVSRLIRNRLELVTRELLRLIVDGDIATTTQAALIAAIKHSKLLGDFMHEVAREHYRTFKRELSRREWQLFLESTSNHHPEIEDLSEKTKHKIGNHIYKILAEAGYLSDTKSLKLRRVVLLPEIKEYLLDNDERYVLECMDIAK